MITMRSALAEAKAIRAAELAAFESAVRKHHAAGMTPVEIARRLGCSRAKAQAACARLGLSSPTGQSVWRDL